MAKRAKFFMMFVACLSVFSISLNTFGQDQANFNDSLNKPYVTAEMITLPTPGDFESYKLTVKGPENYHFEMEFSGENVPFIDPFGFDGESLLDGGYTFQLVMVPKLSDDAKDALRFARVTGDLSEIEAMRKTGSMPSSVEPQYGYFHIKDGFIVVPGATESVLAAKNEGRNPNDKPGNPIKSDDVVLGDVGVVDDDAGIRDQIILDDLIVDGSACIGFDCVNGESFGFDTLRLKENNLRIKFQDTSASASFPSNDWQITANDSSNGGANKFSIDDIDGGRTPFTIEASAPSNSLYVDDGGRVGLGTSTPVVELHVVDGDSPTLRLEQNGSSGFTPQTWDVAGNETNFFVRDATNGSRLPFKIRPSAPTNSLYVNTNGDIGLGTSSPDFALDVDGGSGDATSYVQSSGGVPQFLAKYTGTTNLRRELFVIENYGEPTFRFSNTNPAAGDDWSMILLANDRFLISRNGSGAEEFVISSGGDVTIGGGLTELSDVNMKENFEEVDALDVLDLVVDLPISTWNYIRDEDGIRHMGPMAQDFAAAFGLGKSTTGITNIDMNGVMVAAIQGLNQRIVEKEADLSEKEVTIHQLQKQNAQIQKQNAELNKRMEDLERMVHSLAKEAN